MCKRERICFSLYTPYCIVRADTRSMSDMEDDMELEDYGFEYSDESQEEEDVDIENQYYNSKGMLENSPEEALSGFKGVNN